MKSILFALTMVIAGVNISIAQTTKQAMSLLDAEQFTKAQDLLEKQVAAAPNGDNYFALGYYWVRRGFMDDAKAAFAKGLAADAKNQLNNIGNAMILLSNNKLNDAKAIIDAALLATKSKNAEVNYRAAEAYTMFEGANDPAAAIALIDNNVDKLKKNAPEYQIVKGDAYLIKNDGGPSVSAYENAITLDQNNTKAMVKIGNVFKRGKNYKRSQEGFSQAIATDSTYAPAYREYGDLWVLAGNYNNAQKNYDKYLTKAEPTCNSKLRYVKMAFLAKNYVGARKVLSEVEACSSTDAKIKNDTDLPRMKGYMLFEEGKYAEAVTFLNELISKLPADKVLLSDKSTLAKSLQKDKKTADALKIFEEIATKDTTENFYTNIREIQNTDKKYEAAANTSLKIIDWKNSRANNKANSTDYLNLSQDNYYSGLSTRLFAADSVAKTTGSTAADSLRKVDFGKKAEAAAIKSHELNSKNPVYYNTYRARGLVLQDLKRDKGLAAPYYQEAINLINVSPEETKKFNSFNLEAHNYFAVYYYYYATPQDPAKGKEYLAKVLGIDANNAQAKSMSERIAKQEAADAEFKAKMAEYEAKKSSKTTIKPGTTTVKKPVTVPVKKK